MHTRRALLLQILQADAICITTSAVIVVIEALISTSSLLYSQPPARREEGGHHLVKAMFGYLQPFFFDTGY